MSRPAWFFFRAGGVERGARYTWRDGYAQVTATGMTYPWHTKREAQSYAKRHGARAVFCASQEDARARLLAEADRG